MQVGNGLFQGAFAGWAALAVASFSERAVKRAASGSPWLLFGYGMLVALPVLIPVVRHRLRGRAWCRFSPDPRTADLAPAEFAMHAALAQADAVQQPVGVDFDPLYDASGQSRPYAVSLCAGRIPPPRTAAMHRPQIVIRVTEKSIFDAPAWFLVRHPRGVRVCVKPGDPAGCFRISHDAAPPPRRLRQTGLTAAGAPLAAAVLIWNLGRLGPYADINPALGAWLLLALILSILHGRLG